MLSNERLFKYINRLLTTCFEFSRDVSTPIAEALIKEIHTGGKLQTRGAAYVPPKKFEADVTRHERAFADSKAKLIKQLLDNAKMFNEQHMSAFAMKLNYEGAIKVTY